jgi:hypothetical protein
VGGGVDWIDLAQDRDKWKTLVNVVMNIWVTQNAGKLSSGYTTGGLSSSAEFQLVMSSGTSSQHTFLVQVYICIELDFHVKFVTMVY